MNRVQRVVLLHSTHVDGQHAARNELVVVGDGEVPRLDSHEVIEGKHQNQTALGANLEGEGTNAERAKMVRQAFDRSNP